MPVADEDAIRTLVNTTLQRYAADFKARHKADVDNPAGVINMKAHNVFVAALGPEVQYYAALVRSLDSSLGNMLEELAIQIARLSFHVSQEVKGSLAIGQTRIIAELLEEYRRRVRVPQISDYQSLREKPREDEAISTHHASDYYLIDKERENHYLIELKIGGDLDNKKSRSEKQALLEQFAILSNTLPPDAGLHILFATAYNRYGEGSPWQQTRVLQYFAPEELVIGPSFWNFICQLENGYEVVLDEYRANVFHITEALDEVKEMYAKKFRAAGF